jgi:hypothetical protein
MLRAMPAPPTSIQLPATMSLDCIVGVLVFLALVAPVYLTMRFLVRLARIRYGFETGEPDLGPPLRICDPCGNTVLEPDFQHCPYCGEPLKSTSDPEATVEGT